MPPPPSGPKCSDDSLDLNLPVPDAPPPALPDLPAEWVYATNAEYAERVKEMIPDYLEWSLARKSREPFVM